MLWKKDIKKKVIKLTKEKERLSDDAIANKRAYNQLYMKENYIRKSISIPRVDYEKYEKLLKDNKMTKIEFIRLAFKALAEGKIKKEKE